MMNYPTVKKTSILLCLLLTDAFTGCISSYHAGGGGASTTFASFSLGIAPAALAVAQGSSGVSQITVTGENGFTGSVSLTASGLPAGVTASFSPSSANTISTMTVTASSSATPGVYSFIVNGASGTLSVTTTFSLTVNAASTPTITSFVASSTTIAAGASSSLTGVFADGTGMITPGNIPVTSGTAVSVSPARTTTYTLTVTPTIGAAIAQAVIVTVTASVPAPTITSFVASPAKITAGVSSSLTGVFANGTGVITPGNITVTSGIAVSVSPTTTTTYTLTVTPSSGTAVTQTVTVTVTASGGTTITSLLGKSNRVLIGLGSLSEPDYATDLQGQGVAANIIQNPDIVDQYLPDFGYSSSTPNYWINYNSPPGSYALDVAQDADAIGAVPMFTLYQMAQDGDGNISWIDTPSQMDIYWSHVRILFQMINKFGKPALVNLEPDFWGYVELDAPNGDPTQMAASVNDQAECAALPNNVTGLAACILVLGRTYAPNALIGFQPSFFGENAPQLANFMNLLGAQNADFTVAETLDRDAGCYEEAQIQITDTTNIHAATTCTRTGTFYLDETNQTTPNFNQEIDEWATYRDDLATKLPIIWWQTPLGVPSSTPGGTDGHYRDDHVDYMFKNMSQYADMGTFGIVFSGGASYQTSITTDGGEFATLFNQYLSAGGVAPVY
jgi:hypothetical protein